MFFLSFKVAFLVASQFICWLPVNTAIIVSFCDITIPHWVPDILITAIIPINSVINPILHTKLLQKMWRVFKRFAAAVRNVADTRRE